MTMVYRSKRNMADLAEGLIKGCIDHFGEPIDVERRAMPEDGATVFTLQRHD